MQNTSTSRSTDFQRQKTINSKTPLTLYGRGFCASDGTPTTTASPAGPQSNQNVWVLPPISRNAYTSSHAVNERTFFSSAKVVTLRESPLSSAENAKTWAPRQCQRRAICPQQPNIYLTSNDDDVDQSWKQGSFQSSFTDSFPVCQATRKTVALHSTLLVLLGEKSGRWSSSPRHCAFSNRSCAHRFAPKWSALTAPRQRRLPELHVGLHGLARSATIKSLKVEWTSHAHAMKHGHAWAVVDRENVLARSERACRWFWTCWNETWNF